MPPIITNPANNGSTTGVTYTFAPVNAHGSHPAITVYKWKITVTTQSNGAGTLKTQTAWQMTAIGNISVTGLPANNNWYYCQIQYYKTSTDGPYLSTSNYFQSKP